jgi:hypothetical protein
MKYSATLPNSDFIRTAILLNQYNRTEHLLSFNISNNNDHLQNTKTLKIEVQNKESNTFNCFPGGLETKANALPEAVACLAWLLTLVRFLCATIKQKIFVKKCIWLTENREHGSGNMCSPEENLRLLEESLLSLEVGRCKTLEL